MDRVLWQVGMLPIYPPQMAYPILRLGPGAEPRGQMPPLTFPKLLQYRSLTLILPPYHIFFIIFLSIKKKKKKKDR